MPERKLCPDCGVQCDRMEVDIGVGTQCGPWSCFNCGWEEPQPSFAEMLPIDPLAEEFP